MCPALAPWSTDAVLQGFGEAKASLDCGNSGTTMRLFCGLLAGRPFETTLTGDPSLSRRPMGPVAKPLRLMGARVDGQSDPEWPERLLPPLVIGGGNLRGIEYALPVASAQLKSALVLAGLQASGKTCIEEPGLSRDHSERMLRFLGAPLHADAATRRVVVDPVGWNGELAASAMEVPGDLSSAAFLLVAAAVVPGSDVTVEQVGLNPTRTGVLDVLCGPWGRTSRLPRPRRPWASRWGACACAGRMGCGPRASLAIWPCVPSTRSRHLAVACALAEGRSEFADVGELRVKESDRIASITRELARAGIEVEQTSTGFCVSGTGGKAAQGRSRSARSRSSHRHGGRRARSCSPTRRRPCRARTSPPLSRPSWRSFKTLGANLKKVARAIERVGEAARAYRGM
jgi:3-phosphoshikimate 1-carboxyvinyltransferase